MANTCFNSITLSGKSENLKKAVDFCQEWLKEKYDSLPNKILTDIPIRKFTEKEKKDPYKHFGTKWIHLLDDLILEARDTSLTFGAESAWSPINPFLKNLCIKFNINAENEFEESGCAIYGVFKCTKYTMNIREMDKAEWFRDICPDLINDELEYFDRDDLKVIEHLLNEKQKQTILSNELCQ